LSPEYESRNSEYYSRQQQELHPTCSVKPESAHDVSRILKIARSKQCPFAVASGGHMCWKGSSNIDGGFVIDLRALNQIDISPERQVVQLGPGATWVNVYAAMEPYNISTTGGRISPVGVGGFLLGGQFS
jgi:FAD/FMN-containing dehydrogenase